MSYYTTTDDCLCEGCGDDPCACVHCERCNAVGHQIEDMHRWGEIYLCDDCNHDALVEHGFPQRVA